jgi:hypothetical protein
MAPLEESYASYHPVTLLSCFVVAAFVVKRLHYEVTTGSRRRAMIREHGCKPVVWYEHSGLLGRLFGLDLILAMLSSAKTGTLHQESRERNFKGRNTLKVRVAFRDQLSTIE